MASKPTKQSRPKPEAAAVSPFRYTLANMETEDAVVKALHDAEQRIYALRNLVNACFWLDGISEVCNCGHLWEEVTSMADAFQFEGERAMQRVRAALVLPAREVLPAKVTVTDGQ